MADDATRAPARTITLVRAQDRRGVGVFCIAVGKKSQFYTFREIPCEIGGRGFAVHRLGQGTLYHVRVGEPEDRSCECMGFLRWGHCKHVSGLMALISQGKLPASATPRPNPPVPSRTDSGA
jgi:hypothetical protein